MLPKLPIWYFLVSAVLLGQNNAMRGAMKARLNSMHHGAASPQETPSAFVWQMASGGGFNLTHMYMPFLTTFVEGFLHADRWKVNQQHIKSTEIIKRMVEDATPAKGDIFVWVGQPGSDIVDFQALQKSGVHSVFVNLEPESNCRYRLKPGLSEIWTYSWKNIDDCEPADNVVMQRYVPSGFLQHSTKTIHQAAHLQASFFGQPGYRKNCYELIEHQFGDALEATSNVWSDAEYQEYIRLHSIFVHLPKFCQEKAPVTSARMSSLLSSEAFVISLHGYPKDEAEFQGLVTFAPLEKMYEAYVNISVLSAAERRAKASRIRKAYAKRFAPSSIFERAGIYNLLDRLAMG